MARRSIAIKGAIVSTAAAAIVALSAPAALANTVNHGSFSCGPDMQVTISWNLSTRASSTLTFFYTGHEVVLHAAPANTVEVNTGQRSIIKWTISSSATITFDGGSCL